MYKSQGVSMFGFGEKKQNQCGCDQENTTGGEKQEYQSVEKELQDNDTFSKNLTLCMNELADVKEKYLRLIADFQNYKKRSEKDRIDWIDKSKGDVLLGVLSIVDNFDRAFEEARHTSDETLKEWMRGFELIHKELYDFLKDQHVEIVVQNTVFDPVVHEAVAQVEAEGKASGDIVDVFEKGFMLKGKVLRTAKVTVAK